MKKFVSSLLSLTMLLSMFSGFSASAATYSYSEEKVQTILDTISNEYSQGLSDEIKDLIYDSDYSDIISDKTTLRNYYSNGNSKSWPISNADAYGKSVVDRGVTVNWGWNCAGCMSYAHFFAYSVFGTIGAKDPESVYLDKNDPQSWDNLKTYIGTKVQPGEHIRINNKHSVIYLCDGVENGDEGFYIAEYWGGAKKDANDNYVFNKDNDQYYIKFYTYASFASAYSGRDCFVYNAFESSAYKDGTPSSPDTPTPVAKTRDIVLVLDVSGSMYGTPLANTKTAAKKFVEQILDNSHDTKIALVTYETYARTVLELSDDKDALNNAIDSLTDLGSTNMYAGLDIAGNILEAGSADKKAIVVMTDGAANTGAQGTSGNITVSEGYDVYFGSYASAIYNLAQTYINDRDYTIYSLGFSLHDGSSAYNLIKYISSFDKTGSRYFWSVTNDNIDDIVFTYEDIADTIVTKKSIVIKIECPVEVEISYDNETLSKDNTLTSFGEVTVTPVDDGNQYLFKLNDNRDYDININGTDEGTMDFKISYMEGDEEGFREFKNVPITQDTNITTSATDSKASFALYIDSDGNGDVDDAWEASINETSTETSEDVMEQLFPTDTVVDDEQPLTVTATPAGDTYSSAQDVELIANYDDALIYYTTDESTPTVDSTLYTEPIEISSSTILKAIAVKEGMEDSEIITEEYIIKSKRPNSATSFVKFVTNGGSEIPTRSVTIGGTLSEPVTTRDGFALEGWYTDSELTEKYDFSSTVTRGFTLFAKWKDLTKSKIILTIGETKATVFGKTVENDVAPMVVNERTMLPIRFIAEALGAEVEWDGDTQTVTIVKDDIEIIITIDSDEAIVNGETIILDSPAFTENQRTYLPLRFISENLGANVDWDGDTQTVTIIK